MAKCCAPNCSNSQRKDSAFYSFHSFPEDPNRRAEWIFKIGRLNWTPGKRSLLCSAHFENHYFKQNGSSFTLCKSAIPSIFNSSEHRKKMQKSPKLAKNVWMSPLGNLLSHEHSFPKKSDVAPFKKHMSLLQEKSLVKKKSSEAQKTGFLKLIDSELVNKTQISRKGKDKISATEPQNSDLEQLQRAETPPRMDILHKNEVVISTAHNFFTHEATLVRCKKGFVQEQDTNSCCDAILMREQEVHNSDCGEEIAKAKHIIDDQNLLFTENDGHLNLDNLAVAYEELDTVALQHKNEAMLIDAADASSEIDEVEGSGMVLIDSADYFLENANLCKDPLHTKDLCSFSNSENSVNTTKYCVRENDLISKEYLEKSEKIVLIQKHGNNASVVLVQTSPTGIKLPGKSIPNIAEIAQPVNNFIQSSSEKKESPSLSILNESTLLPSTTMPKLPENTTVISEKSLDGQPMLKGFNPKLHHQKGSKSPTNEKQGSQIKSRTFISQIMKWQTGTWMCRLCGVASNCTINIFGKEAEIINLLERIASVLPIKILQNDGLPHSVCSSCISQLDTCSQLIVTSLNTHKQLATMIGKQDSDQLFDLPVLHGTNRSVQNNAKGVKRKILMMEVCHDEEKSIEECLALASEDIKIRLLPKSNRLREPLYKVAFISLCNESKLSCEEKIKNAVEAFISEDKNTRQLKNVPQMDEQQPLNIFHDESSPNDQRDQKDNLTEEPETSLNYPQNFEHIKLVEITERVEIDPLQNFCLPFADSFSSYEFKAWDVKMPKLTSVWKSRDTPVTNLQKIFSWKNSLTGGVQLVCRLCQHVVGGHDTPQNHFKNHINDVCHVCFKIYSSKKDMNNHACGLKASQRVLQPVEPLSQKLWKSMKNKQIRSWFVCSFCSARLKSRPSLLQHLQLHYQANAKCKGCQFEAADINEALNHRQSCSKLKPKKEWRCKKCMEVFSSEEELKEHLQEKRHEDSTTEWLCDSCGKRFSFLQQLTKHKRIHIPAEFRFIHQCIHCPRRFTYLSKLKEHMQRHEEKSFMCKECGKLFGTKQTLRQHEYTHGEPLFLCTQCKRSFFRKSHLVKHMKVHDVNNTRNGCFKHPVKKDGLNRCRECKQVFAIGELLTHYKSTHPTIALHDYTCDVCNKENTSYGELFQHQRDAHKRNVKDCPFCMRNFDSPTQMKYHLMRHEGMFPYNCPKCSNGYSSNSVLQDHIRRKHTGEKPFECKYCSKGFPTSGSLAQHYTVHKSPHQLLPCPVCSQGFKRKAHLDVHMRTHTGEKPYPCPICERPFRQRPDCVKHIRVIHGEDPSQFKINFHPNLGVSQVVSVTVDGMELVLDGRDLIEEREQTA